MISKLKVPNVIKKKFTLSSFQGQMNSNLDESVKPIFSVDKMFNFDNKDGVLKGADGLEELQIKGQNIAFSNCKPLKVFYYNRFDLLNSKEDDRLIVYCDDKKVYSLKLNEENSEFVEIENLIFNEIPSVINYKWYDEDVLIMSTSIDGLYLLNGDTFTFVEGAPAITSMCVHSERLFITTNNDENTIWFSDDFDFTNWYISLDEAGYITLADNRGKLLRVFSFLNYVYVFREYGISRIYAYGDQEDFSVENLYSGHGKIYKDSITFCGNSIIFLATDGVYRFNGVECVKILKEYDEYLKGVNNDNSQGIYFDTELKLLLNAKIDGREQNVILNYNLYDKHSYLLKDFDIVSLTKLKGEYYGLVCTTQDGKVCAFNKSGNLCKKPLKKIYKCNKTDFMINTDNKKLYELKVNTNGRTQIVIEVDNVKHFYLVNERNQTIYPNLIGENFSFEITTYKDKPVISKLIVYFSYIKEHLW